jgi:SpoVK/Ycf46/Vps4 family AAA+-type ATPase
VLSHWLFIESMPYTESAINQPDIGVEARAFNVLINELDRINGPASNNFTFVIGRWQAGCSTAGMSCKMSNCDLGVTNRSHAIHPALTRSGRLDRVIELNIKTPSQRESILHILCKSKSQYGYSEAPAAIF